ncbi:MAG: endonuclease/exonuclease/phosphatase family protein [Pseudomonadota bacterium]|nr:endonuclease/exonuclease/phosphatase family protein [Pseudomonadota bacterium]
MYKPKHTPLSVNTEAQHDSLPERFTLLVWNLQKSDFSHYLHRPIEELIKIPVPHILSLQEAATQFAQNRFFNLPFVMAPNIQTSKGHFGVVTASSHQIKPYRQCLTHSREIGLTTHKTSLITHHPLSNGEVLTHVNIHAINFVRNQVFNQELQHLWSFLTHQSGPMIISGDFNTWNKTRLKVLQQATTKLKLQAVNFPDTQPIKTMLRQPLDHIFYRELTLQNAQALNVPHISDHNPLVATFLASKNN